MILAQPTQWISRRTMLAASATFAFVAFAFLQVSQKEAGFMLDSGIRVPVPFMQQESSLQGKVTYYGTRNGIDIYEVTYRNGELYENLMPDRIYLVHVPNTSDIIDSPLDVVMSSVTTGSRNVNYYGYRYSDAAATMERRDIYATRFADRFPGQFFASNKARTEDAKFGNMLGAFEQERGVVFRKTDGSAGSVRLDPAGALYAMIVNEDGGASFSVRKSGICGNNNLDLGEECDDGNTVNADSCTNMCTFGLPIPFDSGNTATGTKLSIATDTVATTGLAVHGQTGVTLVRFSAGATEDVRFTKLVVRADTGSLADAMHYTLWKDTDGNGQVDQVAQANVAPQGGFLTFDTIGSSNGQLIAKNKSMVFQIVADIVASPTQKTLRVVVATATADYVGGFRVSPAVALAGIRTNGVCGQAVCQMEVVTKPSTLYSFVTQPQCGNGTKEPPEQCDDGNQSNTDTCTNICKDAVCGDTFKQGTEACDDGNTASGDGCSATCQVETANPVCGNGTKEGTEQCDDGNTLSGDGCSSTCQTETPNPVCGNGTREGSETCDDGNTTAGDGCSATCAVESGYTCNTATPNVCTEAPLLTLTTLSLPAQRSSHIRTIVPLVRFAVTTGAKAVEMKGLVFTGVHGVPLSGDVAAYLLAAGDSEGSYNVDSAELCFGGPGELICDEVPNPIVGSLRPNSTYHFQLFGFFYVPQADVSLQLNASSEPFAYAITDEPGNYISLMNIRKNGVCQTTKCEISLTTVPSTNWTIGGEHAAPVCGDMIIATEDGEACDDGNTLSGDGCSSTCQTETPNPVCGNGTREGSETCDDGNTTAGDGCSATCAVESGYTCNTATPNVCTSGGNPVCGNGTKEGSEQCDDGNQSNTDSCTNACLNAACGDTFKQGTEQCDDGNTASGDGCSATCTSEPLPDAPLTINVKTLPATSSATVGQTDLTFVRFDAVAGDAEVLLQGVMFKAATGSLSMINNPSLWRDTTGDGVGDVKVLDKAGTSTPTTLVFFATSSSANRLIAAGQTVTFEVRGDIASDVQAPAVVRLGFKTSLANFVTALDTVSNQDLSGIATDGICLFTCDIEVFDHLSTLWNISSGTGLACGNGLIEAGEQCDDGDAASGDGCSDACAKESEFRCTGQPSVCISYLDYVKELADTNNNDVVSDNEALILTLDVADAPDRPFAEVSQYDMDQDGDVDSVDVAIILTQLDILAP